MATADIILDEMRGEMIAATWHLLEPLLQMGIDRVATDGSTAKILEATRAGRFKLWAIYRREAPMPLLAAAATYVRATGGGPVAVIDTLGGHHLDEWMESALAQFEALAKANGMTRIEIDGRPGWQKARPDYRLTRVVLQKVLTNG